MKRARYADSYAEIITVRERSALPVGFRKVTSVIISVIMVLAIVCGYVFMAVSDENNTTSSSFTTGLDLSGTPSAFKTALSSIGSSVTSKAYAALSGDCSKSTDLTDAESTADNCVDSMLNTKADNGSGNDAVIAKDANGHPCPSTEYTVNAAGSCVLSNDVNTSGTIKDNPNSFIQRSMKATDAYESSTPSLIDILSMIVNRVVIPGYYINSDFQNYTGSGTKVAPYTGDKGSPADIGKAKDERTAASAGVSDTVAHMYAWRDMDCKTGLTDVLTGKTGSPTLNTSNCDIPSIGTEAAQDLAALITPTGIQNGARSSAKTPFGFGYASDLLPTDGVPVKSSDRTNKYTAMELFGYQLGWTSYAGEFDHIKVMTGTRFTVSMSLGNALKVAGNALSSFGQGAVQDAASDWGKFTDNNNDWWTRTKSFFGFFNPFKHFFAGAKAAGYSLMSDVLYSTEVSSTEPGSWYRPDFVSQTVYGVRELTSIEQAALTAFKSKASMWQQISKHTLQKLDFQKYYAEHAIPPAPSMKTVRPTTCDADDKEQTKNADGSPKTDKDGKPVMICKEVKQLETWDEYRSEQDLKSKAAAISFDVSQYDSAPGDATAKYNAMKSGWDSAMKESANAENEKIKQNSYNGQINDIIGTAVSTANILVDMNNIGKWYCVDDAGNPEGKSTNTYVQLAVSQGIMADPGKEAFNSKGVWQCSSPAPRPTIIGGMYGSAHKGSDAEYKDTRRTAYTGLNLFNVLIGSNVDKMGGKMLSWSQNVVMIMNTLVGWSFEPILDKIGFTDMAKHLITGLRDSVYMQFIVIFIGLAGLIVIIKLVRGQPIQSFQQIGMILLATLLGFVLLFNTDLMFKAVDDMPTALERAAIGTVFSVNGNDKICTASGTPRGTVSAGSFEDLFGSNTGFNPDSQVRVMQCKIWEAFVLTPWAYGQYGTGINQLYATGYSASEGAGVAGEFKVDDATQKLVGDAGVDMGDGVTIHNWGIYQLAHMKTGTISTEDTSKSDNTIDKNLYKLVDLQAGPNNAKGRDTSRWDVWRGASDSKLVIGLTSLGASILGLIALGGLALKKIQYTIMASLLLLISPFILLLGVLPGKGQSRLKTYFFEILSLVIKRVLIVTLMTLSIEIILEVSDGSSTAWSTACIGIYAVCLGVIYYGKELTEKILTNINKRKGDWDSKESSMMNALTNNTFANTMKQDARDIFIGGTGAAIGLILAGSAINENSRSRVRGRLNDQIGGSDVLLNVSHGKTGARKLGDSLLELNTAGVLNPNGKGFRVGVGDDTKRIVTMYQGLMTARDSYMSLKSEAEDIRKQIGLISHSKDLPAERQRLVAEMKSGHLSAKEYARRQSRIKAIDESMRQRSLLIQRLRNNSVNLAKAKSIYDAKRKAYLTVQNSYLKKSRLKSAMDGADLDAQVTAAAASGGSVKTALGNVLSNKMQLALKERNRQGIYDKNGLTVDDVSLASEASFRISRVLNRSRLSRLRQGKSNFLIELNGDISKNLDAEIKQSQYQLAHRLDDGYYGVDEDGHPITKLSDAVGINGVDDAELKRIVNSTANPMLLQADIDAAVQTGDWRQVRSGIGDILNNEKLVQAKMSDWKYSDDDLDDLVNIQLGMAGKDLATASLRDEEIARQHVIENIDASRPKELDTMREDMAMNNVIDRFEVARKEAMKSLLGDEYEEAVSAENTEAGQNAIKNRLRNVNAEFDSQIKSVQQQEDAVKSAYGWDVDAMSPVKRAEYEKVMSGLEKTKTDLKNEMDINLSNVVKSKSMESNWASIAESKVSDLREQHAKGEITDSAYEDGVNKIVSLAATIKTSENQISNAIIGKQASFAASDVNNDNGTDYEGIQRDIDDVTASIGELKLSRSDYSDAVKDLDAKISTLKARAASDPSLNDSVNDLIKEKEQAAKDLNDVKTKLDDEFRHRNHLSTVKRKMKHDAIEAFVVDGKTIDPKHNAEDLMLEAQDELDNVINGSDSKATRSINKSTIDTSTIAGKMRSRLHGGVQGAVLSSEAEHADKNVFKDARVDDATKRQVSEDEKDYSAATEGKSRSGTKPSRSKHESNWKNDHDAQAFTAKQEMDAEIEAHKAMLNRSPATEVKKAYSQRKFTAEKNKEYWSKYSDSTATDLDNKKRSAAEGRRAFNDMIDETDPDSFIKYNDAATTVEKQGRDVKNDDITEQGKTFSKFVEDDAADRLQNHEADEDTASYAPSAPHPASSSGRTSGGRSASSGGSTPSRPVRSQTSSKHHAKNIIDDKSLKQLKAEANKHRGDLPVGDKHAPISDNPTYDQYSGKEYYTTKDKNGNDEIVLNSTLRTQRHSPKKRLTLKDRLKMRQNKRNGGNK
jgi:hypothetical protein